MKGAIAVGAVLLVLTAAAGALAQTPKPTQIIEINMDRLPVFKTADTRSLVREIDKKELASQVLPWPILEISDNGMFLVEFKSERVWVVDSTVRVDATAKASAFAPEAMNFDDKDLAGSRGYGD